MKPTERSGGRGVFRSISAGVWGVVLALASGQALASNYDFSYRLSGDRRVAPVQVFDDGQQTWLQFAPGQVMPAVFMSRAGAAPTLASYQQQGPYLVLQGTANQIDLRIGDILARADYTGQGVRQASAAPRVGNDFPVSAVGAALPGSGPVATLSGHGGLIDGGRLSPPTAAPAAGPAAQAAAAVPPIPVPAVAGAAQAMPVAVLEFDAAITDRNMRRVLERWARQAGWVFQAEHWTVDVDIPLVGAAAFGADFRSAVRGLLAATELGERPLQPCFYANRVLRVVALSQACDRTVSPLAAARP